jgi:hypothetical protein
MLYLLYMPLEPLETSREERIEALLKENQRILAENNLLLRKMRRTAIVSSLLRFVWFLFLLGSGIYVYFTYIQPNLESIKTEIEVLRQMVPTGDSFKQFYDSIRAEEAAAKQVEITSQTS